MDRQEFTRLYQTWDINQRISWERFARGGAIDDAAESAVIREWARTEMPNGLGSYLEHPELGPLLLKWARDGYSKDRVMHELSQTAFWKTTANKQREFDFLERSDPASAKASVDALKSQIFQLISQEGVGSQFSDAAITDLATNLARNGTPAEMMPKQILGAIQYSPTSPNFGRMGARVTQVKQMAADYLMPVSDEAAFDWAKNMATGQMDETAAKTYFQNSAKGWYSHYEKELSAGMTMKQISEPYKQIASKLLEKNPEDIDMTDSKYNDMLRFEDPKDNVRKGMTLGDAENHIRGLDEWNYTKGANEQAAGMVSGLAKSFGAI